MREFVLRSTFISSFLFFFILSPLYADFAYDYIPYSTVHYNDNSGISMHNIRAMIQDRFGLLYFSTNNRGLFRYDGRSWINYTKENAGLGDDSIIHMAYDGNDTIYMVNAFGLITLFNILTGSGRVWKTDLELREIGITRILIYPRGYITLLSDSRGLFRFDLSSREFLSISGTSREQKVFSGGWQNLSCRTPAGAAGSVPIKGFPFMMERRLPLIIPLK